MSASIIQTRRGKEKEDTGADIDDGKVKQQPDEVESNVVQVVVQEEEQGEDAHAESLRVEAQPDSHVQIIATGSVFLALYYLLLNFK